MKVRQLIEKFQENWPVKISCFIIALLIYIFYNISTLESKSFNVPLKVNTNSGFVPLGKHPSRVRISVTGKKEDISMISEKDFEAFLDLTSAVKNGKEKFPVIVNLSDKISLFDSIEYRVNPDGIELRVEEQFSNYSSVSPLIYGEPAKGYVVESVKVTPKSVKITGPKSMVENCSRLQTSRVNIGGASVPLSQKVSVENAGDFLKLSEVTEVTVEVNITPKKVEKEFKNIPTVTINLSDNLELKSKGEISAHISGNENDIEKYIPAMGDFILDLEGITEPGPYEIPVKSKVSSKFKVVFPYQLPIELVEKKEAEQ